MGLTVIPAAVAVDAMLRVYAQTRFLLVMNFVRLGVVAALIGWFLGAFGLIGAVLITLLSTMAAKALAVVRIATLLQVDVASVLPWRALGRMTLRALVAAFRRGCRSCPGPPSSVGSCRGRVGLRSNLPGPQLSPGVTEPAAIRVPVSNGFVVCRSSGAPSPDASLHWEKTSYVRDCWNRSLGRLADT